MAQDAEKKIKERKEDLLDQELQKMTESYFGVNKDNRKGPSWL
jgi:hypothetical protein